MAVRDITGASQPDTTPKATTTSETTGEVRSLKQNTSQSRSMQQDPSITFIFSLMSNGRLAYPCVSITNLKYFQMLWSML